MKALRTLTGAALIALTITAAACSDDSPTTVGTGTPKAVVTTGNNQSGMPGDILTNYLVVQVNDDSGHALSGVNVTWTVTSGGGTLSAVTTTTDMYGRAIAAWTLGSTVGPQTVSATVDGLAAPVQFTAIANGEVTIPR